jgi:hypothetical protein
VDGNSVAALRSLLEPWSVMLCVQSSTLSLAVQSDNKSSVANTTGEDGGKGEIWVEAAARGAWRMKDLDDGWMRLTRLAITARWSAHVMCCGEWSVSDMSQPLHVTIRQKPKIN